MTVSTGALIAVIYVSSAKRPLAEAEILQILEVARANNERLGVTGMLLYREGNFLHILEGPAEAVDSVLTKIKLDSRHGGLVVMSRRSVENRQFGDWPLAFRDMGKSALPTETDEDQPAFQLLNLFKLAAS